MRTNVSSLSSETVNAVAVAGTRPPTEAASGPLKPTRTCQLTGEPFELTSARCPERNRPDDERDPYLAVGAARQRHDPRRVSVQRGARDAEQTSIARVWPGLSVSDDGETMTSTPLIEDEAVYVRPVLSTFATLRLTVWSPARSPIAIDGMFMSLGSNEWPAASADAQTAC